MAAALLTTLLIFHGGGGFALELFGKDRQALVREVVADPARAAAAVQTMKRGEEELQTAVQQFEPIANGFSGADAVQPAGLEELLPFMKQASEQRRVVQRVALDHLFELRGSLTEDEWRKVFATLD
jgi:hypothetical protein